MKNNKKIFADFLLIASNVYSFNYIIMNKRRLIFFVNTCNANPKTNLDHKTKLYV